MYLSNGILPSHTIKTREKGKRNTQYGVVFSPERDLLGGSAIPDYR